jgi:FixJ family two-component response regulator
MVAIRAATANRTKVQYRFPNASLSLVRGACTHSHAYVTGLFVMGRVESFVVVIDDDESVSRAIKRLLRSIGVVAESFVHGEAFLDAWSSIPSYHPECVILDVQMPGLNGLEVQRRLAGSGLPIIFITAYDDVGMREQAISAGALAYLRKPFDDEIFISSVRAALAMAHATG